TGPDNSPYNAISATAIDPTTLDLSPVGLEDLPPEQFEAMTVEIDVPRLRHGPVKYRRVKKLKWELLEKAFARFLSTASEPRRASFEKFCADESGWLRDYALFRALMEANGGDVRWDKWRTRHRKPETARAWVDRQPAEKRDQLVRRQEFFSY